MTKIVLKMILAATLANGAAAAMEYRYEVVEDDNGFQIRKYAPAVRVHHWQLFQFFLDKYLNLFQIISFIF